MYPDHEVKLYTLQTGDSHTFGWLLSTVVDFFRALLLNEVIELSKAPRGGVEGGTPPSGGGGVGRTPSGGGGGARKTSPGGAGGAGITPGGAGGVGITPPGKGAGGLAGGGGGGVGAPPDGDTGGDSEAGEGRDPDFPKYFRNQSLISVATQNLYKLILGVTLNMTCRGS